MAGAAAALEDLIKEYLVFRGFTATVKAFESELKADRDKSFRVSKIVDQLRYYVSIYDISSLRQYWEHLDKRFFKRVDFQHYANVRKLETCLLRLYIVNALQNYKIEKVTEFFEKYAMELQQHNEWREWFAIPFIKNPEQNATFEMFFQKSWQETFYLSLYNFIITLFHHMPVPTLLKYNEERGAQQRLEAEVVKLKQQVVDLAEEAAELQQQKAKLLDLLEYSKPARNNTVEDEDADEFLVVPKPPTPVQKTVFQKVFNTKIKERPKKNKSPGKAQEDALQTKAVQKKQVIMKQQQQQLQVLHEQERLLYTLQEEHKASVPFPDFSQSQDVAVEAVETPITSPELSSQDQQQTETDRPGLARKSQSFDSGSSGKTSGHDDVDSASVHRATTLPRMNSAPSSSPSMKGRTSQPKNIDDCIPKPFIHLGQEEYKEHHAAVTHCRFSSSGRTIASADTDGIVKVWTNYPDIKTCTTIMSKSPLLSLEWATKPDRLLLLGTANGKVRLYDTENKKSMCDLSTDAGFPRVVSLSCSPTGTAFVCSAAASRRNSSNRLSQTMTKYGDTTNLTTAGSNSGVLQFWDMKTLKVERHLPIEPTPSCINCTGFNHNGTLLVTGATDGMIRLYDMHTFDCLMAMQAHVGEVYSVQFSVDETTIYSMGADGKFSQWSVHRMGRKIADLDIHEGAVNTDVLLDSPRHKSRQTRGSFGRLFAFDSEGQYVLTCGPQCGLIYKIENQDLTQVLSLPYHRQPVLSVDWTSSLSCSTCLTGSQDGTIQVTSLLRQ
ncbi:WD repeat-containing protein 91 isoform X2 [Nematostella vectensis]|uniref:WD repeat-containing protein 91 isoform X2 n=1 Tax=Nematostella vectensis TaxID=45351 RepID=UPI002076DB8A|nr:WD repeat-containing protein 91 isoform X2 [Nematostella vectensis]